MARLEKSEFVLSEKLDFLVIYFFQNFKVSSMYRYHPRLV